MTEQHIELYKKYKPATWDDLIGQTKTARSLQMAVVKKKIPTAFLFSGIRGTGKTSSAFLLAKSLNCLNPQPRGNPCNLCETCHNIDNGSQIGVNYISMANKGSVDDIRQLVGQAKLSQPVEKPIWILDEVHNLSKAAFDALLIPLEDARMPSLFILCSTEIDKIPQTILSRVQSRNFTLVDSDTLLEHLKMIDKKEGLNADEDQMMNAIRRGRGSVRDTLSSFESILATEDETDEAYNGDLLVALSEHDLAKVLKSVNDAVNNGYDGRDLAEQLFSDLRDLLLIVSGVDRSNMGMFPVEDIKAVSKGFLGRTGVSMVAEEIGDAITHMTLGADSRIHLEIALVKATTKLNKLQKMADQKR